MPPILALFLTIAFVAFLFRRDRWEEPKARRSLWIPVIWMALIGSRFVSQWLAIFGIHAGGIALEEGSPVDRLVFLALLLAGVVVLRRRQVALAEIIRNNRWLALFFLYSFLAIAWSDFPFVAFKRWIKILGHPVMALVILTEAQPEEAMRRVLKRTAFLLLPLSVCFIKYFPEIGRGFDSWGNSQNIGVNNNKNELGYVCLIFGLFFFWNLLTVRRITDYAKRRAELILSLTFLAMVCWLIYMARSATSLVCLLVGAALIVALASPVVKRYFGAAALLVAGVIVAAEMWFGLTPHVLSMLGKDSTLTDRTKVWADALSYPINPLLGAGFETFWLGSRLEVFWEKWWWQPNQAHNGYIETYLNLGLIGVCLFAAMILATYRKCRTELVHNPDYGRFRMAFLIVILLYNYTEATFKAVHFMWTMFHLIAMDYVKVSGWSKEPMTTSVESDVAERGSEAELVSSGVPDSGSRVLS